MLGMGDSNNENALEWAKGRYYGGYIIGTTLHYFVDKNNEEGIPLGYDEYGTPYLKHEFIEKTIEINSEHFGVWGDLNGNMTGRYSGQDRLQGEIADYQLDRYFHSKGSSTEYVAKNLKNVANMIVLDVFFRYSFTGGGKGGNSRPIARHFVLAGWHNIAFAISKAICINNFFAGYDLFIYTS